MLDRICFNCEHCTWNGYSMTPEQIKLDATAHPLMRGACSIKKKQILIDNPGYTKKCETYQETKYPQPVPDFEVMASDPEYCEAIEFPLKPIEYRESRQYQIFKSLEGTPLDECIRGYKRAIAKLESGTIESDEAYNEWDRKRAAYHCSICGWWFESGDLVNDQGEIVGCDDCRPDGDTDEF